MSPQTSAAKAEQAHCAGTRAVEQAARSNSKKLFKRAVQHLAIRELLDMSQSALDKIEEHELVDLVSDLFF